MNDNISKQIEQLKADVHNYMIENCTQEEIDEIINIRTDVIKKITKIREIAGEKTDLEDILEHVLDAMETDNRSENDMLEQMGLYALTWDIINE